MKDDLALTTLPGSLHGVAIPLEPTSPRRTVELSEAAADHIAAWEADQRATAIHEAGHGLCGAVLGLPVKDIDITERHGGRTVFGFSMDNQPEVLTDAALRAQMVAAMAGSAAERVLLGQHSTLGRDDLGIATQMAMFRFSCGFEPDAPLISLSWVPGISLPAALMEEMAVRADGTIREARDRADAIMAANREPLLVLATRVYDRRRLAGAELDEALASLALVRE